MIKEKCETESGIEVKEVYRPEDVADLDYGQDLGDPGKYPFTRGMYEHMYRGRTWQEYVLVGFGTTRDTNERLRYLREQLGQPMLNVILDMPSNYGLDSDHPMAQKEAGQVGIPLSSLEDMEQLCEGIPIEEVNLSFQTCPGDGHLLMLAQYIAVAQKRGIDLTRLRGSMGAPPTHRFFGYPSPQPLDLSYRVYIDSLEWCARNKLRLFYMNDAGHVFRENSITPVQEMTLVLQTAREISGALIARGLSIDDFASRFMSVLGIGMDFFEEVCKVRAGRRIWARIAKELGAQNPRTCAFNFVAHSCGSTMTYQQPLNNITRGTIHALASAFGGCQGISIATFDEPLCVPTKLASRVALDTLRIIEHETGIMDVIDPLAGSYYVEWLTDEMEKKIVAMMDEIEEMGGIARAAEKGWVQQMLDKEQWRRKEAIDKGEKIVVGVNKFRVPPDEEEKIELHQNPPESTERQVENVRRLRQRRDNGEVRQALDRLWQDTREGKNVMPAVIEAVKAYATTGEIWGVMREASGYSYDPFNMIESPFKFGYEGVAAR